MPGRDPSPALRARRALYAIGLGLPGTKLTVFAQGVLAERARRPDARAADVARDLLPLIEDGPVSLVAYEPELRDRPLDPPAVTVTEAAERVLIAVAMELWAQAPE